MIQEYINYLRNIRGYSENTARAYRTDLQTFVGWLKANTEVQRWRDITRDHIDAYITAKANEGLKPSSTNRHLAAISGLYKFAQRQGHDLTNPTKYESRRKTPETTPSTLLPAQINEAYKHAQGLSKTILGILATTGVRIQELLNLKWEDIDFTKSTLHIVGKGSKERIVHTEPNVLEDLRKVSQHSNPQLKIFYISQRHARYLVYQTLKPYCRSSKLNPHTIRHTFATELAKNGTNQATITKILGHSRIETAQKYIDIAQLSTAHQGIILT